MTYNTGTPDDPCFADTDGDGKTEILPDPHNKCDTPETVDAIQRYNVKRDAAREALGLPKD